MNRQGYQASRVRRILVGAVIAAVLSRFLLEPAGVRLLSGILYMSIALFWTFSLSHRIGPAHTKRLMVAAGIMLTALFVLQNYRYSLAPLGSFSERFAWFGYYVPYTFIPVLSFLAAVSIDRGYMPSRWDRPLLLANTVLGVLILTNDLHQLLQVYVGSDARGVLIAKPGPLYYFAMVWASVFTLAALAAVFRRLRVDALRKKILLPTLISSLGILFCIVFVWFLEDKNILLPRAKPFRVNDLVLIVTIASWESVFWTGLVPSNEDYEGIFTGMRLNAAIGAPDGSVTLRSAGAAMTDAQMQKTLDGPVTEGGFRYSSRKLKSGRVYWADDLTQVEKLGRELADMNAELEESVGLLKTERELEGERASLKARTEIHEGIYQAMEPKLQKIEERAAACRSLEGEALREALAELCVFGAYVKRSVNLQLMEAEGRPADPSDLDLSIAESLRYLSLLGIDTEALRADFYGEGAMPSESISASYDRFESLAEQALALRKGGAK